MSLNRSDSGIFSKISSVVVAAQPRGVGVDHHILSFESAAYVMKSQMSQFFRSDTTHTLYFMWQ
jgi:pyruvate dehydrogenase complex dehydrogenase (E1) component